MSLHLIISKQSHQFLSNHTKFKAITKIQCHQPIFSTTFQAFSSKFTKMSPNYTKLRRKKDTNQQKLMSLNLIIRNHIKF